MKKSIIAILALALLPLSSSAQSLGRSRLQLERPGYRKMVRVGATATIMPTRGSGEYENEIEPSHENGAISAFASFGRYAFSVDAGLSYVQMSDIATIKGADGLDHNYIVNTKFVGAPIYAKYNTFNGELGAFSLKAGVIPMSLQEQLTAKQFVSVPSMVTLGVVGFDGTAYVGNRLALMFIVDYFNRFAKADDGIQNEGLRMGVGVSRDL